MKLHGLLPRCLSHGWSQANSGQDAKAGCLVRGLRRRIIIALRLELGQLAPCHPAVRNTHRGDFSGGGRAAVAGRHLRTATVLARGASDWANLFC